MCHGNRLFLLQIGHYNGRVLHKCIIDDIKPALINEYLQNLNMLHPKIENKSNQVICFLQIWISRDITGQNFFKQLVTLPVKNINNCIKVSIKGCSATWRLEKRSQVRNHLWKQQASILTGFKPFWMKIAMPIHGSIP